METTGKPSLTASKLTLALTFHERAGFSQFRSSAFVAGKAPGPSETLRQAGSNAVYAASAALPKTGATVGVRVE